MILATFLLANPSGATEYAFGAHTTCHLTNTAAQLACQSQATRSNQDPDYTATCQATLGGYQVVLTQFSETYIAGTFASVEAGSGFCSAEFENEIQLGGLADAINTDLGIAEQEIDALQTVQNDLVTLTDNNRSRIDGHDTSIATLNSQRIAQGDLITTNQNQLVTIGTSITGLTDTQALIQSDIGALQTGQSTNTFNIGQNGNAIANNELYIQGVQSQVQQEIADYETQRMASEAQTSSDLQVLNGLTSTTNILIQDVVNAQQQNENAIAVSHGNFDTQISYLSTINHKLDQINAESAFTNTQLGGIAVDQLATSLKMSDANFYLEQLLSQQSVNRAADSGNTTFLANAIQNNSAATTADITFLNTQQAFRDNVSHIKLDALKTAIDGVSFDISGQNITIDNSGVESRLDTDISNDAVYANQRNTKLDTQIATGNAANDLLNEVVVAVTYDPTVENESITNQVFNYLNGLWAQDLSDYNDQINSAIAEAQLSGVGLDTTDVTIIGATASGFAAAQACTDYTFDFGAKGSFSLYCVQTAQLRMVLAWAMYIITAIVLFELMVGIRPQSRVT
jgi:hypothetical protein